MGAAVVVSHIDPRRLTAPRTATAIGLGTAALLVAVLTPLGTEIRGTQGWFHALGLSFQPAEVAKTTLVIVLASILSLRHRQRRNDRLVVSRFVAAIAVLLGFSTLVIASGETGSVFVYAALTVAMLLGARVPARLIALLAVSAIVALGLLVTSDRLASYQRDRIESFLDVDADPQGSGYNQRQSIAAIGSGGVSGKGLFSGPQTQLRYLPEQQTDFIFAVVGEELGFLGGVGVLVGQAAILFRVLALARPGPDPRGELICLGVFGLLAFQVVQNVGMNLRLLPVMGLPLPFVSYGGSSLLTSFIAVGLVQSVARRRLGAHHSPYRAR